jgi:hypothetical protein
MRQSELLVFATIGQKAALLRKIRSGRDDLMADHILEGLQDLGLIDHKNNVTQAGLDLIARAGNNF